jgi:hypothetical protein
VPDAVVVNLGTNDVGSGSFQEKEFEQAYEEFVLAVSGSYGGAATMFLACGPMSSTYCAAVKNTVAALRMRPKDDGMTPNAVYFLDHTNQGQFNMNCCGHPSATDDSKMAQSGAAFIAAKMGWENGGGSTKGGTAGTGKDSWLLNLLGLFVPLRLQGFLSVANTFKS